mgnify:FL=1
MKNQKKLTLTVENRKKRDFPRSTPKNFQNENAAPHFLKVKKRFQKRNVLNADAMPRLQKVLAQKGIASRRTIEEWIKVGRIQINGKKANLGDKVLPTDKVKIDGKLVEIKQSRVQQRARFLIYHKMEGEIVSRRDPQNRPSVFAHLPRLRSARWINIGRLDFNTSGLLLFTTSGDLANRLMHPSFGWEREYSVRILGELTDKTRENLLKGVMLEDGFARFLSLDDLGGTGANRWYRVVLEEGRNREVRRLFQSQGLIVSRLIRTRFGTLRLPPRLKRGKYYEFSADELRKLLSAWGIAF